MISTITELRNIIVKTLNIVELAVIRLKFCFQSVNYLKRTFSGGQLRVGPPVRCWNVQAAARHCQSRLRNDETRHFPPKTEPNCF